MKIKRIAYIVIVIILLISGVVSVALYKVGDRVLDEIIENTMLPDPPPSTETGTTNTADQQKQEAEQIPNVPATTEQPTQGVGEAFNAAVKPQISKGKIEEIKEEVTTTDKMSMAAMVFKRLSQEDIRRLLEMATGGITSTEKEKMKELAFERFTEEEIQQILGMYYKYMN